MSQENVEVVRRFFEAGQRSLEAYWKNPRSGAAALEAGDMDLEQEEVLAFLHPEVEIYTRDIALQGGPVRGHLGWLRMWDDLLAASEDYKITLGELGDLGGSEVLAAVELAVKWKASGMEQADTVWYLATLRSGLLVRFDAYFDRAAALEAAGLSEQDAHADS